jgi:hypothetical protein
MPGVEPTKRRFVDMQQEALKRAQFVKKVGMVSLIVMSSLCVILAACAPAITSVKDISSIPSNEVLVFGEIITTNFEEETYIIILTEEGSNQASTVKLHSNERVYWQLKPGKYLMRSFVMKSGLLDETRTVGRIWVKFEVPNENAPVYIGTLKIEKLEMLSKIIIEDNMDIALAELNKKFSMPVRNVKKSLMKKENN